MEHNQIPCDFCAKAHFSESDRNAKNIRCIAGVYPNIRQISVVAFGFDDSGDVTHGETFQIPMNYCPNCGRRLGQ